MNRAMVEAITLIGRGFTALAGALESEPVTSARRWYLERDDDLPPGKDSKRAALETARREPSIRTVKLGRRVLIDAPSWDAWAESKTSKRSAPIVVADADAKALAEMGVVLPMRRAVKR